MGLNFVLFYQTGALSFSLSLACSTPLSVYIVESGNMDNMYTEGNMDMEVFLFHKLLNSWLNTGFIKQFYEHLDTLTER